MILPMSAGRRESDALEDRAIEDAQAGRPMATENPLYGEVYLDEALWREADLTGVVVCFGEAVHCEDCGDLGPYGFRCSCQQPRAWLRRPGMLTLLGVLADERTTHFTPMELVRQFVGTGMRVVTPNGEDITHRAGLLQ